MVYMLKELMRIALEYALREELENIRKQGIRETRHEEKKEEKPVIIKKEEEKKREKTTKTLTIHRENISVENKWEELIKISGKGVARSIIIRTDKKDFRVYLEIDDPKNSINKDFDWFVNNSSITPEWYAGEDDNGYVLVLSNISFSKKLLLMIKGYITIYELIGIIDVRGDNNE